MKTNMPTDRKFIVLVLDPKERIYRQVSPCISFGEAMSEARNARTYGEIAVVEPIN